MNLTVEACLSRGPLTLISHRTKIHDYMRSVFGTWIVTLWLFVMNKTWLRVLFYSLQMHLQGLAHARCHVYLCWAKNRIQVPVLQGCSLCLFTVMQGARLSGGLILCLLDVQNFHHLCIVAVLWSFIRNEWPVLHSVVIHQVEIKILWKIICFPGGGKKFSCMFSSCCFKMYIAVSVSRQTRTTHRLFMLLASTYASTPLMHNCSLFIFLIFSDTTTSPCTIVTQRTWHGMVIELEEA